LKSLLVQHDANKDGVLSVKEAVGITESIENFDLNQDGKLDESELLEFLSKSGTQPNFAVRPVRAANDPELEWAVKQIKKYDRNGDGRLTVDEWSSMITKPEGADTNKDGAISAEEFAIFRSKRY